MMGSNVEQMNECYLFLIFYNHFIDFKAKLFFPTIEAKNIQITWHLIKIILDTSKMLSSEKCL